MISTCDTIWIVTKNLTSIVISVIFCPHLKKNVANVVERWLTDKIPIQNEKSLSYSI